MTNTYFLNLELKTVKEERDKLDREIAILEKKIEIAKNENVKEMDNNRITTYGIK